MRTTGKRLIAVLAATILMPTLVLTASAQQVVATGGDSTNDSGGYRIHTFTTVGTHYFNVTAAGNVDVLVVAGGGGGSDGRLGHNFGSAGGGGDGHLQ